MSKRESHNGQENQKAALSVLVENWMSMYESELGDRPEKLVVHAAPKSRSVKPKSKIDPSSDKARALMGLAIRKCDLEKLKELVEGEGLAIDVVKTSWKGLKSALLECMEQSFIDGFVYLQNMGAPKEWVSKNSGLFLKAGVNASGKAVPLTREGKLRVLRSVVETGSSGILDTAFDRNAVDFIELLWQSATEEARRTAAQRCNEKESYDFLVKSGYESCVGEENKEKLCLSFLNAVLDHKKSELATGGETLRDRTEKIQKYKVYYKQLVEGVSPQTKAKAWYAILLTERLDVLKQVVSEELSPTPDGALLIRPQDLYAANAYGVYIPRKHDKKEGSPKKFNLEELVCLISGASQKKVLLKAALNSTESRKKIEESEEAIWALAFESNIQMIRYMKKVGLDLNKLVDEGGNNPLHYAVWRQKGEAGLIELAKVYPEWCISENKKGQKPVEMLGKPEAEKALNSKFELVVINSTISSGPRGKRTKAIRL